MGLNLKFGVISALVLLMTSTRLRGSSSGIFGTVAFTAVLSVSSFHEARAIPSFFHRMGPPAGSIEDESGEEDNESQARVEPQITSLNRDECLAKLLCGMSVPVTGTGAPKEGYYSEYANIVARFFEAFPLDDEEKGLDSSPESIELYDDYSLEDTKPKPSRINSKKRKPEGKSPSKSSTGLQLIDLALIKTSDSANKTQLEDDDERIGRRGLIKKRESRARKIVAKLGEKLQTVRQCQQISGCPFTFKQLRSRLKSRPSITSNVPLGEGSSSPSINYNYNQPGTNRPSLHKPSSHGVPHKGDDEIEEFYGPPPIVIKRPQGFGINQVSSSSSSNTQQEYVPYDPHTKTTPTSGPMFPKKKLSYSIPNYKKPKPNGQNDEFDDVNKSTGPVTLVGDEVQSSNNDGNNEDNDGQEGNNNDDNDNDSGEYYDDGEGGGDNDDYYNDGDDSEEGDNEDDESVEGDEEEEEDTSGEEKQVKKKQKGNGKNKKKQDDKENDSDGSGTDTKTKPKVVKYKKPSSPSTALVIEEEFEKKRPGDDDELEHPDNVWSKFTYATSGGLLKEPKDRVKTPLEEKNDEKLNLSASSEKNDKESSENSSEEAEEEDEQQDDDEDRSTRNRVTKDQHKVSIDDDEEFEATKDFMQKYKPKRRANPKYGGDHGASGKRRKTSESKEKSIKGKKEKEDVEKDESGSEEEYGGTRKGQIETIITHIGGRPIVPPPEKSSKAQKKVGGLGRFKFNLIRPYGSGGGDGGSDVEESPMAPSLTSYKRKATSMPPVEYKPSLPEYVRPTSSTKRKKSSSSSSKGSLPSYSLKPESPASYHSSGSHDTSSKSEGYIPKVSFGSTNAGKLGTVEYLGAQSAQAQAKPGMLTFPFGNPLSSLKSLFHRPGSSGDNQDIPGGQNTAALGAFVHRPVGPESSKFRRIPSSQHNKGKGKKGKKSGSKNKRRH